MIKAIAIMLILVSACFSQQSVLQNQEIIGKGEEIIDKSRETVGINKIKLNSIHYKIKTSRLIKMQNGTQLPDTFEEISFVLPDKIQAVYSVEQTLPYISTKTWNGEKYKSFIEIEFMGKKTVRDDTNANKNISLDKLEGVIAKDKLATLKNAPKSNPKQVLTESMWTTIFPLLLSHPFESNLRFNYVGKAQANSKTANVVDMTTQNGKRYRLLFDTESNYLLMMIVNYKRNDSFFTGDVETKYYFSSRELTDGISIPKQIKVENKQTSSGKLPEIIHSNIEILEFQINPTLKESLFDIK